MSSKIRYTPPPTAAVELLSITGTIPAARMKTLSSNPFVIFAAGEISQQKIFVPLFASCNMRFNAVGLAEAMGLTYDLSVFPFFDMNPTTVGGGLVTGGLNVYGTFAIPYFDINNVNQVPAPKPPIVWKAIGDSPATDMEDVNFEIIYCLRDVLA